LIHAQQNINVIHQQHVFQQKRAVIVRVLQIEQDQHVMKVRIKNKKYFPFFFFIA
jgi:hypothetical protein